MEVEPAGMPFQVDLFPDPFPHVSRQVSSLLGGLSVQEVAQLFDSFRGKVLTRAGVESVIVKRSKAHGKLLNRPYLRPNEKTGVGYKDMKTVGAGDAMEVICPNCLTPRAPEKTKCLFCKS